MLRENVKSAVAAAHSQAIRNAISRTHNKYLIVDVTGLSVTFVSHFLHFAGLLERKSLRESPYELNECFRTMFAETRLQEVARKSVKSD